MKRRLGIVFLILLFSLFLVPDIEAKAYDYTIESYNVDMKVTKQNVYRITETIAVNFLAERHGIYRNIPLKNNVIRQDGSTSRVMARVENVSCSDEYDISRESDNCCLQIGDEDETIIGKKQYTISYDYVMGNDVLQDSDEFYYNVIGTGWQTTIENVTFSIQMPKKFAKEKLGMLYGSYGAEETDGLSYFIEENTIHGELDSTVKLYAGQGVTVRLLLEEGYFEKTTETPIMAYLSIGIAVLGAVLAFVFWYLFGRDDEVVETVEFYPPDGLNSLELAFAYKGSADADDVISLLVYLAQKGYISIEEKGKKDFVIRKEREYDGFNSAESAFFEGLFKRKNSVSKSDLEDSFYTTVERVRKKVDNSANKKKLYYANSLNKGWILWGLMILSFVLALFKPVYLFQYTLSWAWTISLAMPIVFGVVSTFLFMPQASVLRRVAIFSCGLIAGVAVYFLFLDEELQYSNFLYTVALVVALLMGMITMFFNDYMSKRTPYGTEILGRILGFRNFLETAELDKLESMVQENPQYFYDILPYTYVLDLSDTWMRKFEALAIQPPQWYVGSQHSNFDVIMFHHFMNTTISQAQSSMTSVPSSSSGGGFTGGGSGGGGGGSW